MNLSSCSILSAIGAWLVSRYDWRTLPIRGQFPVSVQFFQKHEFGVYPRFPRHLFCYVPLSDSTTD